jgi:UDP-galactopyranose mutase
MHITIGEALEVAERFLASAHSGEEMPPFVVDPLG